MDFPEEPKYKGLPRRYEETKPALEQVFTHNAILRVGNKILGEFEANSERQKEAALEKCKETVWKEAELYKDECIERVLQQAAELESQRLEELGKQHEEHLQHEITRVTELMRQQNVEDRYEERKECENQTKILLEQMQRKNELEKMSEIKATRAEEQAIANNNALAMMHRHEEAMRHFREEMEEAKNTALIALQMKLDDLRNNAVQKAREEEREIAQEGLQEVFSAHKAESDSLHDVIQQLSTEKQNLQSDLEAMTKERDDYVSKYNKLQNEFTNFIEGCRPDFSSGQADFLLPPI